MSPQDADESAAGTPPDSERGSTDLPSSGAIEAGLTDRVDDPSDAFQALGNEIRMDILRTMLERANETGPSRATFSELFEAADVDTSAGFAYHLEQLVGPFLRKSEEPTAEEATEGYELTSAGLRIARAIATGTYTRRIDHPPVGLEDPCPFCEREALEARSTDNVVTVACADCERTLLELGFPPSGLEGHGAAFPAAFDRHHRHRLALMRDGVCPECAGDVTARFVTPATDVADELPAEYADHVQASLECDQCGTATRCPVTLTLLKEPSVVSFYRDHGRDIRDQSIWNVGHEWAETVLSEEPPAVRVVVELEGDVLALYVDDDLQVVDVQRSDGTATNVGRTETDSGVETTDRSADSSGSTSAGGEA